MFDTRAKRIGWGFVYLGVIALNVVAIVGGLH